MLKFNNYLPVITTIIFEVMYSFRRLRRERSLSMHKFALEGILRAILPNALIAWHATSELTSVAYTLSNNNTP